MEVVQKVFLEDSHFKNVGVYGFLHARVHTHTQVNVKLRSSHHLIIPSYILLVDFMTDKRLVLFCPVGRTFFRKSYHTRLKQSGET